LQYSADDPDQVRSFAQTLEHEGHRLAEMTNDIIELTRLQSLGTIEDPDVVPIDQVVENAISTNKALARKQTLRLLSQQNQRPMFWGTFLPWLRPFITWCETPSPIPGPLSGGGGVSVKKGIVEISVTDQGKVLPKVT
jgi:two-component system, OmpR family, sensor histidine kinase SenX3